MIESPYEYLTFEKEYLRRNTESGDEVAIRLYVPDGEEGANRIARATVSLVRTMQHPQTGQNVQQHIDVPTQWECESWHDRDVLFAKYDDLREQIRERIHNEMRQPKLWTPGQG